MHGRITFLAILTLILALPTIVTAQVPQVRVSQAASITQTIGLADVSIRYHRPGVKEREIWGGLLAYGEIWRAGANEPTIVTFSEPVTVGGTPLKAGSYRFVVIPNEDEAWTVIFNSETKNWGTVYDAQFDVARVSVDPTDAEHEEWMSFSFDDLSGSGATLVLRWEEIALRLPLAFDTEKIFASRTAGIQANVWRATNGYARYLLDYGNDLKKALDVAESAVAMERNTSTLRTKAEIMGAMKQYDQAIELMNEVISMRKKQNPDANVSFYQGFITRWEGMK